MCISLLLGLRWSEPKADHTALYCQNWECVGFCLFLIILYYFRCFGYAYECRM